MPNTKNINLPSVNDILVYSTQLLQQVTGSFPSNLSHSFSDRHLLASVVSEKLFRILTVRTLELEKKFNPLLRQIFALAPNLRAARMQKKLFVRERLLRRLGIYCCDTDDRGRFIITTLTIGKSFIIWNPSPGPICEIWLKLVGAEISLERISASISARPPSLTLNPNR